MKELPLGETLKDTVDRFVPYFKSQVVPSIKSGKKLLIAAHGNSLRALVKHIEGVSDEEIVSLNIPTGVPLVYELDQNLNVIKKEYLGDQESIRRSIQNVAEQGNKKMKK